MSRTALISGIVAIVVLAGGVYYFNSKGAIGGAAVATAQQPIEVRWLLSHYPTEVFARASAVFADELSKQSNGELALKVVAPGEVGVTKGDIPNADVFKMLNDGSVQLATAYTVALGNKSQDLWAVNLPFLFKDSTAVEALLDGAAGQSIFAGLPETQGVVGLAFTMSGGYRIIASKNTKIASVADLKGKRIATSGGPVAEATLKALGAIPVSLDLESATASIDANTIDGVEITYSRLGQVIGNTAYTKHVNETNHSVFLTAILAEKKFFDSLTPTQQAALKSAAIAAAKVERADSAALGAQVKADLQKQGSTITTLSAAAVADFTAKTKAVYDQFLPTFSAATQGAIAPSR